MEKNRYEVQHVAGIPLLAMPTDQAVSWLVNSSQSPHDGVDAHFLNAYSISIAHSDQQYRDCLESSVANFPDGKPLTLLTKWSAYPLTQLRGPDLFERVISAGRETELKHFLLGGSVELLEALERQLRQKYPGVDIVGSYSPPFRTLSTEEIKYQDAQLSESNAHIIWVGLGTPKQDYEVMRLASKGFFAIAVGAAFDFSAGTKPEAPKWVRTIGIEWLFRFASEPTRLWKRYLFGNAIFLWSVLSRGIGK